MMKHVGSTWIVNDLIPVVAVRNGEEKWQLTVNGVQDASVYDSPEAAAESGWHAAEKMADIIRQIEVLQVQLAEMGVGTEDDE